MRCAWSHFSPAQQERLRNAFKVNNTTTSVVLEYTSPASDETAAAALACGLSYDAAQLEKLGHALGGKAGEEAARMGAANRGVIKPGTIDRALASMHEDKRRTIGDALSCGGANILSEWDQAVIGAMRRTNLRIVDGRTVSLIAVAMFATFLQEGYMRRIAGTAAPCPS